MNRRRVKQISTSLIQDADYEEICVIVAVCDDGTIWRMTEGGRYQGKWHRIESIPQTPACAISIDATLKGGDA